MFVGVGTQAAAAFASKNSMLRGEKVQILMRICPHYFKSTLNPNVLTSNSPAEFREHSIKKKSSSREQLYVPARFHLLPV